MTMERDDFSNQWADAFLRSASVSTIDSSDEPPPPLPTMSDHHHHHHHHHHPRRGGRQLADGDTATVSTQSSSSDGSDNGFSGFAPNQQQQQQPGAAVELFGEGNNNNNNNAPSSSSPSAPGRHTQRNQRYVDDTEWLSNEAVRSKRGGNNGASSQQYAVSARSSQAIAAKQQQQRHRQPDQNHVERVSSSRNSGNWASNDATIVTYHQPHQRNASHNNQQEGGVVAAARAERSRRAWTPTRTGGAGTTATPNRRRPTSPSASYHTSAVTATTPRGFSPLRNKSAALREAASRRAVVEQRLATAAAYSSSPSRRQLVRHDGEDDGRRGLRVYPPKRSLYAHSNASSFIQMAPGAQTCTDFTESDADVLLKCVRCITFGNFVPQHEFRVRIGVALGEARDIFAQLERDDGGIQEYIRTQLFRNNNASQAPSSSMVLSTPLRSLGILNDDDNFQHTRTSLSVPTTWFEAFAHNCMSEIVAGACTECWGRWFGSVSRRRVEEALRKFTRHNGAVGMMLDRNSRGHLVQIPFVRNRY